MSKYKIIVYNWNPNGTNDIAIEGSHAEHDTRAMDGLSEACFGIDIKKFKAVNPDSDYQLASYVPLKTVLKHIAVSPVSDGSDTINFLSKYFKSVKGVSK